MSERLSCARGKIPELVSEQALELAERLGVKDDVVDVLDGEPYRL